MKKIISLLLLAVMAITLFGCAETPVTSTPSATTTPSTSEETSTPTEEVKGIDMKVFAMKGPTGMGMAKLIADSKTSSTFNNYNFTIAENVNECLSQLIGGEFDIAAVPTNFAASVLNNKASGLYSVIAVNTLGVLYILDNDGSIKSVSDLEGKTIYATGEGTVPQFVLEYVLTKAGFEIGRDVNVEYLATADDVGKMLEAGTAKVAMLPQPYVTTLQNKSQSVNVTLDLTEEWDKLSNGESRLMTGCVVVKNEVLQNNRGAVEKFLEEYSASVDFVNSGSDEGAQAVVDAGIVGALAVAKKAIPKCNIVFITGDEMKNDLSGFYAALYSINPQSVGGKIPGDELYAK